MRDIEAVIVGHFYILMPFESYISRYIFNLDCCLRYDNIKRPCSEL